MRITLPWPPKQLSPNARLHWATKAKAVASYRSDCGWRARAQGVHPVDVKYLPMRVTFHPPDARRRDRDNLIASCKALMDGLSDALGVDDSYFIPTYEVCDTITGGAVIVSLDVKG
jgi:crossover junction endodeoxyribonuclease RusA